VPQGGLAARRLVRDPVCGTHVAEVLAIPLREGGELVHFCSAACRDKYVNDTQRLAANG
jgi:YHS domain-containing protein